MLKLHYPLVLIALILPWLIYKLIKPCKNIEYIKKSGLIIPFFNDLQQIIKNYNASFYQKQQLIIIYLIWSLICISLSDPCIIKPPMPIPNSGYDIMLVLDISPSMGITDMISNGRIISRLTAVKKAANQFVKNRTNDQIGLIAFGEKAYLLTPLTYDYPTILERLNDMTIGLAGNSTSIGDAIGLALKRLDNNNQLGRIIILLTDGVNNTGVLSPMKAASLARDEHIHIYTIGLGSNNNNPTFGGVFLNMNNSDLDEDTLKAIADKTQGHYFRATDPRSLNAIYSTINTLVKTNLNQKIIYTENKLYPWTLSLAFLIWLIGLYMERKL